MVKHVVGCIAAVAGMMAIGCGVSASEQADPAEKIARQSSAIWGGDEGGYELYGRTLNGRTLDGLELAGHGINGVSLRGVRVGTQVVDSVSLDGTVFVGSAGHRRTRGRDFVGARFDGLLPRGATLPLRIDAISTIRSERDDRRENETALSRYAVSYLTDTGWRPFCGADARGAPVLATPLTGRWDYRQGVAGGGSHIADPDAFTFACEGYALAKCVDLGYQPWRKDAASECEGDGCLPVSFAALHQSCTRALRADYCGDGDSWTNDGTMIGLFDASAVEQMSTGWRFEAEWDENGARCATSLRQARLGVPGCWSRLQRSGCGAVESFETGTRLMTQLPG